MAEHDPGFTLTLEGPTGPSSVVFSEAECLALVETVAAATARVGGVSADDLVHPSVTFGRLCDALRSERKRAAAAGGSMPRLGRMLLAVCDLAEACGKQSRRFEQAVAEARLEAMRQLAYGAGHEINNPLANIATRAQSLLPGESDPERRRRLAAIIDQAFRARDMIGGLMIFARPPKPVVATVAIADVARKAVESIASLASAKGILVTLRLPEDAPQGRWDRSQLEEALRAILLNAVEAGGEGGTIEVDVEVDRIPDGSGRMIRMGRIRMADDGPGMDRETLDRAFDPFFSGREAGRGIGIGLPKAWRLVEINGGRTIIDSRAGAGTTVSVLLPIDTAESDEEDATVEASDPSQTAPLHGRR